MTEVEGVKRGDKSMKNTELKLIAELLKNCHRSDRELAKAVGVSQPTISRTLKKLEKEGVIRAYSIIPDFAKLGFEIASVVFVTSREGHPAPEDVMEKTRQRVNELLRNNPIPTILALSGLGLQSDRVILTFHRNYSDYTDFVRFLKEHPLVDTEKIQGFIIPLNDKRHYMPLDFSLLIRYLAVAVERGGMSHE